MDTGSCEYDLASLDPVAAISGYDNLPVNDQDAIMNHIANVFNLCLNNLAKLESFRLVPSPSLLLRATLRTTTEEFSLVNR